MGTMPVVLKKLMKESEFNGYQRISECKIESSHLVPFVLFKADSPHSTPAPPSPEDELLSQSSPSPASNGNSDAPSQGNTLFRTHLKPKIRPVTTIKRDWCWMPHYPQTLDGMARPYSSADASKIISQMLLALEPLHENKLAHMDIKPSNIFIEKDGTMALGDFVSVRTFGSTTSIETTITFIPRDKRDNLQVHSSIDFLMLAMTVVAMVTPADEKTVGEGSNDQDLNHVVTTLKNMNTSEANMLVTKITL
jgi:hypothetical protein